MYLVGQEKNKYLIDNGKLDNSNFIIIKGPKKHGKTYLTKYIADHYKMNYVLLDNKVDTVRKLVENSGNDNNCLYHFKDFEKSSPAAKAALLKICEETPRGVKIVITTSGYNMLDTLISRAYNMDIQAYSDEEIEEYTNTLNLDKELVNKLKTRYNITITPTFLIEYKSIDDFESILTLIDDTLRMLETNMNLETIGSISSNFWDKDLEFVRSYLNILSYAILNDEDLNGVYYTYMIHSIIRHQYMLSKLTITNFKQFIHNMLMELVE